mmetsp:Transcript_18281/g.51756  ORF Transcript_18281/g.51756 Transcript_18281/m.51756 type:complete len:466 (+) Transcript_18281:75-1472(+)|eukprot:CAMPEP_0179291496 /NCGR_PEP_ID=MMETSP0797-20121207/42367_1 /TAXON_ID=47934 /ORGANISM="Dinophysis acuminata, Strain DAEP01" /LENGTH=465 /DNA_ID=CAMNT_0021000573 /DNA_START=75 /DNA_END=1472 /DNA_ORIENTATION=-
MSKAAILAAERELKELEEARQKNQTRVEEARARLAERRSLKAKADADHQAVHARSLQMRSVRDEAQGTHAQCNRDRDNLEREFALCDKKVDSDRAAQAAVTAAHAGLSEAQASLAAVCRELRALSGEQARQAALEAAGGELSTDVVPAPVPAACETDAATDVESLWVVQNRASEEGAARPVPLELRHAMRSKAVLTALQRSLCVRAADMRESLKIWGFTRSAALHTQELCTSVDGDHRDTEAASVAMEEERKRLRDETEAKRGDLEQLQREHEALQAKHAVLLEERENGLPDRWQAKRNAARHEFEDADRAHWQLTKEHNDEKQQLDTKNIALADHDIEAVRRCAAAQALAQKAEEQARVGRIQLEQAQEELQSFQRALEALKQANDALHDELIVEVKARERLQYDHDKANSELNGLAYHYLDALPLLAGLDHLSLSPEAVHKEPSDWESSVADFYRDDLGSATH